MSSNKANKKSSLDASREIIDDLLGSVLSKKIRDGGKNEEKATSATLANISNISDKMNGSGMNRDLSHFHNFEYQGYNDYDNEYDYYDKIN